jgi:hypothetical protein
MNVKTWSVSEIRALARQTVDGRKAISTARGAYFRALIETSQAELGGKADQAAQLAAVKAVHRRFYPVVQEATTTPDIVIDKKATPAERKRRALERNRRTNFARSAYGTIRRWLRAPDHDIMKLDASKATKSQLLEDAPPTRKHALTRQRVHARASKLIDRLLLFTKQLSKSDQAQAAEIVHEAVNRLFKQLAANVTATTDASVAAQEGRPLRVGRAMFIPTEAPTRRVA